MGTPEPVCVDFDYFELTGRYKAPQLDLGDDVSVSINTAPWMANIFSLATYADIRPVAFDGWTENALSLSNVYLAFYFGGFRGAIERLSFRYHDSASRHYIEINRDPSDFPNFSDVNGKTLGGAGITVTPSPAGPSEGTLEIVGLVETLVLGSGEMLWIDDLCYQRKTDPEPE